MKGVSIEISNLCVSYGETQVLKGIDLSVQPGEFVALLGASGCGKTTLLRSLAGFVAVRGGEIEIDGRSVIDLPPEKRDVAMMFQSYALWPHMTVGQNIAYALRIRKLPKAEITSRVEHMLSLIGLEEYVNRNVTKLSGGQQQRVALARALAIDPPVLLLDEPLSNLDARIRLSMRHEVKALHKKLGITAVLVTHDREEAMSMADRVVILNQGRIEQVGTPEEIYHRPASQFVAEFMGADNAYPVEVKATSEALCISGEHIVEDMHLPIALLGAREGVNCHIQNDGHATAYFRSEAAFLPSNGSVDHTRMPHITLRGMVKQHSYIGNSYRHIIEIGEKDFLVDHPVRTDVGKTVDICVSATALHIFHNSDNAATAPAGKFLAQTH